MRVKLQLVMYNDKGDEETVTDVIILNKNHQRIEHLGLTLAESKQLLSTLQRHLLQASIMASATPAASAPRHSPAALEARSLRGLRCDAEGSQVAETVSEAGDCAWNPILCANDSRVVFVLVPHLCPLPRHL